MGSYIINPLNRGVDNLVFSLCRSLQSSNPLPLWRSFELWSPSLSPKRIRVSSFPIFTLIDILFLTALRFWCFDSLLDCRISQSWEYLLSIVYLRFVWSFRFDRLMFSRSDEVIRSIWFRSVLKTLFSLLFRSFVVLVSSDFSKPVRRMMFWLINILIDGRIFTYCYFEISWMFLDDFLFGSCHLIYQNLLRLWRFERLIDILSDFFFGLIRLWCFERLIDINPNW